MPPTRHTTVGIVGLGLVGTAIARRLHEAGLTCIGHDVQAAANQRFEAAGGRTAASPAKLARQASRVVLAVFDTRDVMAVVHGPQGLLAHAGPDQRPTLVIDCSTGDPALLPTLASELEALGIAFLEAPLSGSSAQIAEGEATMLLGGSPQAVEAHADLLHVIAAERFHVGGPGMGACAKLATNLVLGLNRAVLAEGMVFAERLGIAPERFLALVLASPARSDAARIKGPLMVQEAFEPQSRIRQHHKDVLLMLGAAQAQGQALPLSTAHARLMQQAMDAGDGDLDNAAIIRQIRRLQSEPVPTQPQPTLTGRD